MTWFGKIVNEAFQKRWQPKQRENVDPNNLQFIPHNETAFRPGDKMLYTKNTGKGVFGRYGIITKVENNIVYFYDEGDNNKIEHHRDIFDQAQGKNKINDQLKHCVSWIRPVVEEGVYKFTATDYIVCYEISNNLKLSPKHKPKENDELHDIQDNLDLIVVWRKTEGYKDYYTWPDGEFVGGVNVNVVNVGNLIWLPKIDDNEPRKVDKNKYNTSYYVYIPEKFSNCMLFKDGKFFAWNTNYRLFLLRYCSWLGTMKANWYDPVKNKLRTDYCILDNPQVKKEWEEWERNH